MNASWYGDVNAQVKRGIFHQTRGGVLSQDSDNYWYIEYLLELHTKGSKCLEMNTHQWFATPGLNY